MANVDEKQKMADERLKIGPYLTVYKKDYNKKLICRKTPKTSKQEFEDPICEGFKQYLKLEKTDGVANFYEACEDYLTKFKRENPKIAEIYFRKPLNAKAIKNEQLKGKSVYQVDYCEIDAGIENKRREMQTKKFSLPESWQIPLTTQRYDFREPTVLSESAAVRPLAVKPTDNLGQNEKLNEILNVRTGDSEYNEVIGKLGEFIVEEEMHGKITHPEVKRLWLRKFEKLNK